MAQLKALVNFEDVIALGTDPRTFCRQGSTKREFFDDSLVKINFPDCDPISKSGVYLLSHEAFIIIAENICFVKKPEKIVCEQHEEDPSKAEVRILGSGIVSTFRFEIEGALNIAKCFRDCGLKSLIDSDLTEKREEQSKNNL